VVRVRRLPRADRGCRHRRLLRQGHHKDADGTDASKGNDRPIPWLELATALVAGGTWGIAMPGGPLSAAFTGPAEAIATGSTVVLGASLVALAAGPLKNGTSVNRTDEAPIEAGPSQGLPPPVPA
jgi:hypothetical protein